MTHTLMTVQTDNPKYCDRCNHHIAPGTKAIYAHYYGRRPAQFYHWPKCQTKAVRSK